ncbi:MAG: hypothetical protein IID44_03365 [Planctomycetes bacterium]|nr:hypothetical protein [Planctomycetota bacterium]
MAIANPDDSVVHVQEGVRVLRLSAGIYLVKPRPRFLTATFGLVCGALFSALAMPLGYTLARLGNFDAVLLALIAICGLFAILSFLLAYIEMFPRRLMLDLNHQTCVLLRFAIFSTVISIADVESIDVNSRLVKGWWIYKIHLKLRSGRRRYVFCYATRGCEYVPTEFEKLRPLASCLAELIDRPLHMEPSETT